METLLSIIVGLATLKFSFKIFFNDFDDFMACVKFWFTPDIVSVFRGEFEHDWWGELKLFVWLAFGVLVGYAAHQFLIPS